MLFATAQGTLFLSNGVSSYNVLEGNTYIFTLNLYNAICCRNYHRKRLYCFSSKTKTRFTIGDIIPNSASIYFDFNPAIVTEPCLTEFVSTLSTNQFELNDLRLYPNPVKNVISISNSSIIDAIEITSVLGQEMISKKVNNLQTEIDLSLFAYGIYFVKVSANKQEKTIKIMKE